ncbi:MAG: PAS domain S-box protein, partial [Pseudomonadota bacterium]
MKLASLPSPLRLVLVLAAMIFLIESVVMELIVLKFMPNAASWIATLVDASLLVALLSPVLVMTVLRPLARQLEARERAEKDRECAHMRLASAIEGGYLAVWDADVGSGKVWLSEAWAQFLGESRRETWTTTGDLIALLHPEDRSSVLDVAVAALKGEHPHYVVEHRVRTASGDWRWFLSQGRVIERAADGRAVHASGIALDITERKQMEAALRESEESFRALIESAPQCMILTDSDGRIILVNAQTETTFGYPREELIGRNIELLLPERYRPQHPQLRTDYLAAPTARPMGAGRDLFGLRRDGTELPVEIGLRPIRIAGQSCSLASVVDITERKRAQEAFERASHMTSEFMANVTHELRTPLNSVIGFSELLKDEVPGPLNAKQARFVADIHDSGLHLLKLVDGILDMAQLDADAAVLERQPVDIGAAVQER